MVKLNFLTSTVHILWIIMIFILLQSESFFSKLKVRREMGNVV